MANTPTILVITQLFPSPGTSAHSGTFVRHQLAAISKDITPILLVPYPVKLFNFWQSFTRPPLTKHDDFAVYYLPYSPHFIIVARFLPELLTKPLHTLRWLLKEPINLLRSWVKDSVGKKMRQRAGELSKHHRFSLVHGQEVFVGDEAGPIGKELGLPSVVTIHALYSFHEQTFGALVMQKVLANLKQVDELVTVSKLASGSYANKVNRPITVIPNGYLAVDASPNPRVAELANGRVVLLYVGFLIDSKRVDLLLKAAAELKKLMGDKFVLLIIGSGPSRPLLEKLTDTLELKDNVLFFGDIDPAELPAYYIAADLVVQPSESDSFSMVCLEAMAYGKPFICTSQAGIAEYITDGQEAFVVQPNTLKPLVECLQQLISDKQLRERMGVRAKSTAANLTPAKTAAKLLGVYNKLMKVAK